MESTLAQILGHIFDLEIENAQLKQKLGIQESATEATDVPQAE